ncbi:NAD(P)-dependent oxidoreductase [Clavibacter tessellarius]|uniref:NAD-dependent dehydratase n=1 Tax=Clavibacter tessellarius TaxID=31965 RepID=A0A225CKF9_9MICO|nr:NAD(P)-dependent oxidoreductase [Clavibacter michiganensis]OQJ62222.1 NAD-dependent dehydratase [Clavibacter michiganensis subsp. tessellarius]UKF34775.1 NAD(P)-dependent oxidoreductase [Clavibacter michiganensis subsp. tessellarius]
MGTITITGGSGRIATSIRPLLLAAGHELRLLDVVAPPTPLAAGETSAIVDTTDVDACTEAFRGSDLVVHLAAHASERSWEAIQAVNNDGAHAVHEAVVRAGVPRILAASSIHAVGFLPATEAAREDVPAPRPDTFYGLSKVMLEGLGSLYADRHGHVVVSVRIMTAEPEPSAARSISTWLSAGDAARLVEAVLHLDEPGHRIVWGVSRNTRRWVSLAAGEAIGYHPEDDAEVFAHRFPELGEDTSPPAGVLLGSIFTEVELGSDMG